MTISDNEALHGTFYFTKANVAKDKIQVYYKNAYLLLSNSGKLHVWNGNL